MFGSYILNFIIRITFSIIWPNKETDRGEKE